MRNYHIWTIGCQMNTADSERLESALGQMGLQPAPTAVDADIVVLNSCVVRQKAEDRVVGMIKNVSHLKNNDPDKIVALMGCMVGSKTEELKHRFPQVDVFMQPQQFQPLLEIVGSRIGLDPSGCIGPLTAKPDITAHIPINKGCDKFCSFCIIPYRRGREISRPVAEVVNECGLLTNRGVKEVTLLGQNVDSYGHDLPGSPDLGDLLTGVNNIRDLERIRFLTSHPSDMSDHIIDKVADLGKVCEHINLPFQAGDDEILSKMRRGYTGDQYRRLIEKIRTRIPNVSLSTDLIVGFCGETDIQFQKTLDMIQDVRFDKIHSAAYSDRAGTIAARKLEDNVTSDEKRSRLQTIDQIQEGIQSEINLELLGQTMEILVEGKRRGKIQGRNRNDKLVYLQGADSFIGELVTARITATGPWSLQGVVETAA